MNTKRSLIGIFALVLGFVLWINTSYVFPTSPPYGATPGVQLAIIMLYEFAYLMLFFGGILLSLIGFELRSGSVGSWMALIIVVIVILVLFGAIFSLGVF